MIPSFQKFFSFLLVLNVRFLSPVVADFSLPVFPIKGVSAVTCSGSTGVQVHLSLWGDAFSRATGIAVKYLFLPTFQL